MCSIILKLRKIILGSICAEGAKVTFTLIQAEPVLIVSILCITCTTLASPSGKPRYLFAGEKHVIWITREHGHFYNRRAFWGLFTLG
jgi:hypothetical protein